MIWCACRSHVLPLERCTALHLSDRLRKDVVKTWLEVGNKYNAYPLAIEGMASIVRPLPRDLKEAVIAEVFSFLRDQANFNIPSNRAWYAMIDLLAQSHAEFLIQLFLLFDFRYYFGGDYLCYKNDPSTHFWLLQTGVLEVLDEDINGLPHIVALLYPGSPVGLAGFGRKKMRRSASVRARGTCSLWCVKRESFLQLSERFPKEAVLFDDFFNYVHMMQEEENSSKKDSRFDRMISFRI